MLPQRSMTSRWQVSPRVPRRGTLAPRARSGRLARAVGAGVPRHRRSAPRATRTLGRRARSPGRARPQLERGALADQLAARVVVAVGEQRLHRHVARNRDRRNRPRDRRRRASSPRRRYGRNRRLGRTQAAEIEALEQRQLLQEDRSLAPGAGLAHACSRGSRRCSGVSSRGRQRAMSSAVEQAAVAAARAVHHLRACGRSGRSPRRRSRRTRRRGPPRSRASRLRPADFRLAQERW